jgi:hypothetical protein
LQQQQLRSTALIFNIGWMSCCDSDLTSRAWPAQGCLRHVQEDGNAVYEILQEIKGDMIIAGLKFNKTTHALFVEVHLMMNEVEVVSLLTAMMRKCSA